VYPRIFYKDSSLVWRSPTHFIRSDDDNWIGKGDLKYHFEDGVEIEYSAEETTNLPLEMQAALDVISRRSGGVRRDLRAIERILRRAPDGRFEPYRDFVGPRRAAMADPRNLVHRGENVAWFARRNDGEVPPELVSQIPTGFAGPTSDVDPSRADASPWIERMPVVREFRRIVLGERRAKRPSAR